MTAVTQFIAKSDGSRVVDDDRKIALNLDKRKAPKVNMAGVPGDDDDSADTGARVKASATAIVPVFVPNGTPPVDPIISPK
jgi:hypothetical protein